MIFLEIFIKKRDVSYNAQAVGDNSRFLRIAEMTDDILLFNGWVGHRVIGQQ